MASEAGGLLGRALRAAAAAVQAAALREVMKTLEQPAWRRLMFWFGFSLDFFLFLRGGRVELS